MTAQKQKLLATVELIVSSLRAPDAIRSRLEELGRAHVRYGAKPEHYPIVRDTLVDAMRQVCGPEWSPELQSDWTEAIRLVCEIMQEGAATG